MFGHIKTYTPELRVRDAEAYRAAYCGLCRVMRRRIGVTSAAALSYDMAFLAVLRMALSDEHPEFRRRRCYKPRARLMIEETPSLLYAAGVSALLSKLKLDDDVADERGFSRMRARALLPISRRHCRRAGIDGELAAAVTNAISRLNGLEENDDASLSDCAAAFGDALSEIFAHGIDGVEARIARTAGRAVGRFVYILDEFCDEEEDEAAHRKNRVAELYPIPLSTDDADAFSDALALELEPALHALELVDGGRFGIDIAINIVSLGMMQEARRIISEKTKST